MPDALGIVLLAGGVGALALAIVEAPDWGWGSARVLVAFVARRGRCWPPSSGARSTHPHPVLELVAVPRALVRGGVRRASVVFSLGFYAVLLANILFLTSVWGYSTLSAGFAVTPGPLMAALSSALAGRVIDRYGQRVSAVPGGLLFALGCLLFATGLGLLAGVRVRVPARDAC